VELDQIISLIKDFQIENNKPPTIAAFSIKHSLHPSSIIRQFGSWNSLLSKAGLKLNKANKRNEDELLVWLKSHPNMKYSDMPTGIRGALEERFGSIINARSKANILVTDWRARTKHKATKNSKNAGRPLEYTKEQIITGLRLLALELGRPPRMKDIKKSITGFPLSAVFSRFKTFNEALQQAELPPVYSYQEFSKLEIELEKIMMNIKILTNDIPIYYSIEIDGYKPKFVYENKWEEIKLTRNDIFSSISSLLKYKEVGRKLIVYYLVDDSLYENENIKMFCVMDYIKILNNKIITDKIIALRLKYDEISRKYIGQPLTGLNEL